MIALLLASGLAAATPLVRYDLESNDGDFVATGDVLQWSWGAVSNGPGAGFDGSRAWSTGRTRDYLNDSLDYLEIPVPDLSMADRPTLSFKHYYDIAPGDLAWIEVDPGNGFSQVTPLYGYPTPAGFVGASSGWRTVVVDLTGYGAHPRVRLVFQADLATVADGWTVDQVVFHDGDIAAPKLSALTALPDTEDLDGAYLVEVDAEDDSIVSEVTLRWSAAGVEGSDDMAPVGGGTWRGEIPVQAPGTDVTYWVEGSDGMNESREPLVSELGFRVYLPAPTDLAAPSGRLVGDTVALTWTAPVSTHAVLGYEVLRGGLAVAETTSTEADAPILGGVETFSVRAVYEAGAGDTSAPLVVDGVVPSLTGVTPDSGWPGETIRVRVTGAYLLLVEGDVDADLGAGVYVASIDVRDVDTAYLELAVAHGASPGPRALTLRSGDATVTLADAFSVLPDVERPRLTDVAPADLEQGDTGEMTVVYVGELAAAPVVDLGADIVVESVDVGSDNTLRIRYAVATNAALGSRRVTVDDGVRVLEGVSLEVADARASASRGCGSPVAPTLPLAGIALAAAVRRRRAWVAAAPHRS
jgi:uncharacterized protein (TIGR03382 family)